MIAVDRSVPLPLYSPEEWTPSGGLTVLSLPLACSVGGPLARYYESVIEGDVFAWRVDLRFFSPALAGATQAEIRKRAAEAWFEKAGPDSIFVEGGEKQFFYKIFPYAPILDSQIASGDILPDPLNASDLVREIAPELLPVLTRYLSDYTREVAEADLFPWEGLRYFAGFLRQKDELEAARVFDLAWSRFQAFISPQDEQAEKASLAPEQIILNPTVQTVRSAPGESPYVDVFFRKDDRVRELRIGWAEAALMDEALEGHRTSREELLSHVAHDFGDGRVRPEVLRDEPDFDNALSRLIESEVLLAGD